jgi:hypothetical protein
MLNVSIYYKSLIACEGYDWVRFGDLPARKEKDPEEGGRSWISGSFIYWNEDDLVLAEKLKPNMNRRYVVCEPFKDNPTLYREFADVRAKDDIFEFVEKYGLLDANLDVYTHASKMIISTWLESRHHSVACDTESDWTWMPLIMRSLIHAWESPEEELVDVFKSHISLHFLIGGNSRECADPCPNLFGDGSGILQRKLALARNRSQFFHPGT